jgi:phosphatidylglycerophosphate synthase
VLTVGGANDTRRVDHNNRHGGTVTASVHSGTDLSGHGPTVGLAAQFALLGALAATVGLGPAGWLTGAAYAVTTCALLALALRRAGARTLGPANRVTLARASLVAGVAALVADSLTGPAPLAVLVPLASVALAMDAIDGYVARRTRTTSALGARFDMEIDAFLVLVLSVYVAESLGGWVLAIGALRYLFVAATPLLPWLRAPLPPRYSRKTVAAFQGVALVAVTSGTLPATWSAVLTGLALALLCWSFGRDIGWLWRSRPRAVAEVDGVDGRVPVGPDRRVRRRRVPRGRRRLGRLRVACHSVARASVSSAYAAVTAGARRARVRAGRPSAPGPVRPPAPPRPAPAAPSAGR